MKNRMFLLLLLFLLIGGAVNAQSKYRYCLALQQSFYSWGSCSSDPDYDYAEVNIKASSELYLKIDRSKLNSIIPLPLNLIGINYSKAITNIFDSGKNISSITVHTNASDITNDHDLYYEFTCSELHMGANTISKGASDPCNNWVSNNREGYTMTTSVIIDDPINLFNYSGKSSYCLDTDILTLKTDDYFDNSSYLKVDKPYLEVARDSTTNEDAGNWIEIKDLPIKSSSPIELSYQRIAGEKSSNSRFFKWMGKALKFRVVKTLLNGEKTYGRIVSGIVFYPKGPSFRIEQTRRTGCDNDNRVIVKVILDVDANDINYFNIDPAVYKWVVREKVQGQDYGTGFYYCNLTSYDGSKNVFELTLIPQAGITEDPFNIPNDLPIDFEMQLQDSKNTNQYYCVKTFTIPPKPSPIKITQIPGNWKVGNGTYDVPDRNNIYVNLDINDSYMLASERKPYKIVEQGSTEVLATVDSLNKSYSSLSQAEREADSLQFESEFADGITKRTNGYLEFFRYKYKEWFDAQTGLTIYYPTKDYFFTVYDYHTHYHTHSCDHSHSHRHTCRCISGSGVVTSDPKKKIESAAKVMPADCNNYTCSGHAVDGDVEYLCVSGHHHYESTTYDFIDYDGDDHAHSGGHEHIHTNTGNHNHGENRNYDYTVIRKSTGIILDDPWASSKTSNSNYTTTEFDNPASEIFESNSSAGEISDLKAPVYNLDPATKALTGYVDVSAVFNAIDVKMLSTTGLNAEYILLKGSVENKVQIWSENDILRDVYPSKGIAQPWYDEYKDFCFKKWLNNKYGYKLYNGVKANTKQFFDLIDKDNCHYACTTYVRVPDAIDFKQDIIQKPASFCSKNGIVKVTYIGGGTPPYEYNGSYINGAGNSILVSNLGYGKTTIKLNDGSAGGVYLDLNIDGTSITALNPTDNTCPSANGTVYVRTELIPNPKTFRLIRLGSSEQPPSETTSLDEFTFRNLPKGTYTLEIDAGNGCVVRETNIVVESKVFNINSTPIDATSLGGNGNVEIKFDNWDEYIVTWQGQVPTSFGTSPAHETWTYSDIIPGAYNITASHKDKYGKTCDVNTQFEIKKPQFESHVKIEENDLGLVAKARLYKTENFKSESELILFKDNAEVKRCNYFQELISNINSSGIYKIVLKYGSEEAKLCEFTYPLPPINNVCEVVIPNCPNDSATIQPRPTGGIADGTLLVSDDNSVYSSNPTFYSKANEFSYYVKNEKENIEYPLGNKNTIYQSITKKFTQKINMPKSVSGGIRVFDVTCSGNNDGKISIASPIEGSGKYSFMVDKGTWISSRSQEIGLLPGIHTVYLKDSLYNCTRVTLGSVTISEPQALSFVRTDVIQPTCELDNGAILVEVTGGSGNYKHEWKYNTQPLQKNDDFSNDTIFNLGNSLRFGTYQLVVTDENKCTNSFSKELVQYINPFVVNASSEPVTCYDGANGWIDILAKDGKNDISKFYITNKENGLTDSIPGLNYRFSNLKKGFYILTAKDVLGCKSTRTFEIPVGQPNLPLSIVINSIVPVKVKGTPSGSLIATVMGGNDGLKKVELLDSKGNCINSSNQRNDFQFTLNSLFADKYHVKLTDKKGCVFISDEIQVTEPELPLTLTFKNIKNALCKAQTGSFEVEASGGWGDYSFKREGYNTYFKDNRFENLNAGNYRVTVKDKLGATYSDTVSIYEPDSLRSWVSGFKLPTCSNNGEITLMVNGGTAPYQVFDSINTKDYSPVLTNKTLAIKGLAPNSYIMRVTDSNGCLYNVETTLPNSQMLNVDFNNPVYPSSAGSTDGSIEAAVSGGVEPYTFQWKKRFDSEVIGSASSINSVPSGHYELTVSERGGCSDTSYVYLPGVNDSPFNLYKVGHETTYLGKNGFAILTSDFKGWKEFEVIKPNKEYKHFNIGESDAMFSFQNDKLNLSGLEGGKYFVSGVTTNGEKSYIIFTIDAYQQFLVKSATVKNVDKKSDSDGQIALTVKGGGGGNTFKWTQLSGVSSGTLQPQNSDEGSILDNVFAGEYSCAITDCYGNTISKEVKVLEPNLPLQISVSKHQNETCKDSTNAFVELNASGGWGHYQFREDNVGRYANSGLYSKLGVGNHAFSIVDMQGVTESVAVTITEPEYLRSRIATIDSVNCKGGTDGRVEFIVEGGTSPYRVANAQFPSVWGKGSIVKGLAEGDYIFTFTDTLNCPVQSTVPVTINAPDSLLFNKIDVTHTTCNTDNGKISVDMKGGTKPYSYKWLDSDNQIIDTINSLSNLKRNGWYRLNVVDRNGCAKDLSQRINTSSIPTITDIGTTPVLCYGGNTGTAMVNSVKVGEPLAPYTLKWSNGDTGNVSNGYEKGTYSVKITDANNCKDSSFFVITQPDSLRISIKNRKNALCFGYNDAFLKAQGFGGVGSYTYNWSTGAETDSIGNLTKGDYTLSLKDANGCETVQTFTISEPDMLEVDLGKDIKMCPGNSRVIDGQDFASHEWSTGTGKISEERYLTVNEARDYYLKVTDKDGCIARDTINLSIGNDALKAEFLLSSQAEVGDTLSIFELSNMEIDSSRWDYNLEAFTPVENKTGLSYMFFLKAQKEGIYNIDLSAFSGGCISTTSKQVEIIADSGTDPDDDNLGYKDPLIKSFSVNPNPNDGNFYADVKLRESSDITLILFSIAAGTKLDERYGTQLSEYSIGYNLSNLNSGVYLLVLKAGTERKQVKIIIQ